MTPTLTVTPSITPTATTQLLTLTAPSSVGAPAQYRNPPAQFSTPEGWSCEDFPCEDDIDGFLQRIRVPLGYSVAHVGRFPGQPMQITYGPDGRLYATVLENGTRNGAVYVLDADGNAERYSDSMNSPLGLAFQPGTDTLYVSARLTAETGGVLWRVLSDGSMQLVSADLPCCFLVIDNQPAGMVFGPDGYLYMGVGALSDHAEPEDPTHQQFAQIHPQEAAILRIQPHTGAIETYARGIRYPYDIAFDANGQLFASDNGLLEGPGDRIVKVDEGGHYGWPYWRTRGCAECPLRDHTLTIGTDYVQFPDYTLPRGMVVYTGQQYPENMFNSLFVALWHNTANAQRIVRIDPQTAPADFQLEYYEPEPFVTGLIRPVDVVMSPDGALVIADFIYGHVWRVDYAPGSPDSTDSIYAVHTATPGNESTEEASSLFVTSTPRP